MSFIHMMRQKLRLSEPERNFKTYETPCEFSVNVTVVSIGADYVELKFNSPVMDDPQIIKAHVGMMVSLPFRIT